MSNGDSFGSAIAAIGDLNGNGVTELAVGTPGNNDGTLGAGAIWILFMTASGTVTSQQLISRTAGGLGLGAACAIVPIAPHTPGFGAR